MLEADISTSGAGGLDTGSAVDSRWYRIVAIFNPDTLAKAIIFHLEKRNVLDVEWDPATTQVLNALRDAAARTKIAQGFKITSGSSGEKMRWVGMRLSAGGTITGNVWLTIEGDSSGVPDDTPIATSDKMIWVDGMRTGSGNWRMFLFRDLPTLTSGTQYWIVFHGDYAISAINLAHWRSHTSDNTYADGTYASFDGSIWTADSNIDLMFQIWMQIASLDLVLPAGFKNFATIGYAFRKSDSKFKRFMAHDNIVAWTGPPADLKVGDIARDVVPDTINIDTLVPPVPVAFAVAGNSNAVGGENIAAPVPEGVDLTASLLRYRTHTTVDEPGNSHGTIIIEDHQKAMFNHGAGPTGTYQAYITQFTWR